MARRHRTLDRIGCKIVPAAAASHEPHARYAGACFCGSACGCPSCAAEGPDAQKCTSPPRARTHGAAACNVRSCVCVCVCLERWQPVGALGESVGSASALATTAPTGHAGDRRAPNLRMGSMSLHAWQHTHTACRDGGASALLSFELLWIARNMARGSGAVLPLN
jgi:hypothetical protein